jgi:predicted membrane metal-binding protein
MSGVLLTGFLVERKAFALNNLAAAATLILCWNTNELFSVGFQLSFSVVTCDLAPFRTIFSLSAWTIGRRSVSSEEIV